ncbi:hypothetical protein TUM20286_61870 [Pseudomonas tohonis]|uniref:Uncharacterized protein n=1 Tax=Pseudomonas tohonis TaxID=2725477 RepID=A0ABQ4WAD7_9PSED|nr:hypothetical protein TUM20286_61870 [Pseudomonas tohonis]
MNSYEGQAALSYSGQFEELYGTFKRRTHILLKRTAPGVYDVTSSVDLRKAEVLMISLPNGQTYSGKVLCQIGHTATIVSSNDEPAYRSVGGNL